MSNTSMAGPPGHLIGANMQDPMHFHSVTPSSSSSNQPSNNHYTRTQPPLNHHPQHDSVANSNLVNGFLNSPLPSDALPVLCFILHLDNFKEIDSNFLFFTQAAV